jgi:hypothetical protein
MNTCFDAKLLHIACKVVVLIHLSCFILNFTVRGLQAETVRGGTDPAAAANMPLCGLQLWGLFRPTRFRPANRGCRLDRTRGWGLKNGRSAGATLDPSKMVKPTNF